MATSPRSGGSLKEFKFTDQVFYTQDEAEKFILSQKNPEDFEMMDNTDEESGLSEFIILKRDGAEMSIPQAQEAQSSEEGQTQETIEMPEQGDVESTTQPTQQENLQPQLPQLPQQDQSVTAPVQPETSQPGQEAVAPTLVTQPTQQELAKILSL